METNGLLCIVISGQNGSQQKTKVALQNMLSNRAMSPQTQQQVSTVPTQPGQPQPVVPPPVPQVAGGPGPVVSGPPVPVPQPQVQQPQRRPR